LAAAGALTEEAVDLAAGVGAGAGGVDSTADSADDDETQPRASEESELPRRPAAGHFTTGAPNVSQSVEKDSSS